MGGFTKIPKLQVEDLGTEGTGDRIALFNESGELVGYVLSGDGFIPLSGTEVGKPITGDLEFVMDNYNEIKGFEVTGMADSTTFGFYTEELSDSNIFGSIQGSSRFGMDRYGALVKINSDTNDVTSLTLNGGRILVSGTNSNFKGVVGDYFYDKQNDPNAFAQLGDIATTNETATPLSLSDLNTAYPTQGTGFKVICPALNLIYIKSSLTTWEQFTTTTVI